MLNGHMMVCSAFIDLSAPSSSSPSNEKKDNQLVPSSLIYGSEDAGGTVHDMPLFGALMREVAASLKLAEHPVLEKSTDQIKRLSSAVDVEGHYSSANGCLYLLDSARLLPPTNSQRYLIEHFRAEFMLKA